MTTFLLLADAEFEADDIVDAFRKLEEHFKCLADNAEEIRECDSKLLTGGKISIGRTENGEDDSALRRMLPAQPDGT